MATGLLTGKFGAIRLSSDLRWEADDEALVQLANFLAPVQFSESDGNPHKYLISKLQEEIGGESIIYGEDPPGTEWIGVDLDGTLAEYDGWQGIEHIGAPIPAMVQRVKEWISDGKEVKIFTARVSKPSEAKRATKIIQDWTEANIGLRLEVTNVKDFNMKELWDDRAVAIERNTGEILNKSLTSETNPEKRASLIADIMRAIYGGHAEVLFDAAYGSGSEIKKLLGAPRVWSEIEHPRGPNGRFINKFSSEAVSAAHGAIEHVLARPRSPESIKHLAENLSILTVSQLTELKKRYGIKASGKTKDSLVQKIADRLSRGRSAEIIPVPKPEDSKPVEPVDPKKKTADELFGKSRSGAFNVIGAMRSRLESGEPVTLIGEKITGATNLAQLANIYRDPRYETFRIFFVKDNVIVGQTAYSSRMPSTVSMPEDMKDRIALNIEKVGADGFYVMHNHPSDDPTPSPDDINMTGMIAEHFGRDKFRGHVIIDHDKAIFIDKDWSSKERYMSMFELKAENEDLNDPSKAVVPHEALGTKITSSTSLGQLAMKIGHDHEMRRPVVIITDVKGTVTTLVDVDKDTLANERDSKAFATLRRLGRLTGANGFKFVVIPNAFRKKNENGVVLTTNFDVIEKWKGLFEKPWVTDMVDINGDSLSDLIGPPRRGPDFSQNLRRRSPIVLEELKNVEE